MFIKFALRRNLIYPLQYTLWSFVREIIHMIINDIIEFTSPYVFLPLMFIGEILAGIIIYLYERRIMKAKKEEKKEAYFMSIKLITSEKEEEGDYFVPLDNKIKIIFLIFLASLFDSVQFLLTDIKISTYKTLPVSFCPRLYGISTISAAFFYVYALKLPVYKHHQISLSIIGICLIIVIATEFIFATKNPFAASKYLGLSVWYTIVSQILVSCTDSIEKYLYEYDYMDPFVVLIYEGIFGYLLSFFLFFSNNYLKEIRDYYQNKNKVDDGEKYKIGLIFSLIFYMIISGVKNIFRVVTNKIYSPMTKTLSDYVLNPIYILYYYGARGDFKVDKKLHPLYFSINIVVALIISFFGCVYNEFIILFCCHLEHDTYEIISIRASTINKLTELTKVDDEVDEDEDIDISSNLPKEKKLKNIN